MRRRAVEVIICMITREFSLISMTSQASLSLSLSLSLSFHYSRKVTHAQYRKRFRASNNVWSVFLIVDILSVLPDRAVSVSGTLWCTSWSLCLDILSLSSQVERYRCLVHCDVHHGHCVHSQKLPHLWILVGTTAPMAAQFVWACRGRSTVKNGIWPVSCDSAIAQKSHRWSIDGKFLLLRYVVETQSFVGVLNGHLKGFAWHSNEKSPLTLIRESVNQHKGGVASLPPLKRSETKIFVPPSAWKRLTCLLHLWGIHRGSCIRRELGGPLFRNALYLFCCKTFENDHRLCTTSDT